jgi:hypothetical protein
MNKYLARLKTANSEKRPYAELTELTKGASVGSVSSYSGDFPEPRRTSVSSVSSPGGRFLKIEAAPAPDPPSAPEPATLPAGEEVETPEAAVARRLDAMAAENERRRNWHAKPDREHRAGKITMRSALTGEEVTIDLMTGRTLH